MVTVLVKNIQLILVCLRIKGLWGIKQVEKNLKELVHCDNNLNQVITVVLRISKMSEAI